MGAKGVLDFLNSPAFADLCKQHGVSLAVLFGSQATGQATEASDVDLAVLMKHKGRPDDLLSLAGERMEILRELIRHIESADVDLVILNHADPLLKFQVARTGKPVYQETPGLFSSFCSLAVRQHGDSMVFYRAMERYLRQAAERRKHDGGRPRD
ncbi:MAG: nucleotidyltransferase domain-containing protein [Firmicutes bacterium]|nr:nucleotidyltransferase domain-containing protein [Candidatus Fermentithermobacillaceae bacterium]